MNTITLMSFGFKHGLPDQANILMDVRFLQNPYWVDELKEKTGLDQEVGEYIRQDPEFKNFLQHFQTLIKPLLSKYPDEEHGDFIIAIGCTGGRHRSVYTVECLKSQLADMSIDTQITHRDLERTD